MIKHLLILLDCIAEAMKLCQEVHLTTPDEIPTDLLDSWNDGLESVLTMINDYKIDDEDLLRAYRNVKGDHEACMARSW